MLKVAVIKEGNNLFSMFNTEEMRALGSEHSSALDERLGRSFEE